jgi:hypothetical protein
MKLAGHLTDRIFYIDGRPVINQDPTVITNEDLTALRTSYLPAFVTFWAALEKITGYRWKCTSLIRDSVSHVKGHAIDLAPDISPTATKLYAVNRGSDPVLYKREPLIRALQMLMPVEFVPSHQFSLGVYIEPDHLHVQAIQREERGYAKNKLTKWGIEKPVYSDTAIRSKLPLIGKGGLIR